MFAGFRDEGQSLAVPPGTHLVSLSWDSLRTESESHGLRGVAELVDGAIRYATQPAVSLCMMVCLLYCHLWEGRGLRP